MNTADATDNARLVNVNRVLAIIDGEQKTNADDPLVVSLLERIKNQIRNLTPEPLA